MTVARRVAAMGRGAAVRLLPVATRTLAAATLLLGLGACARAPSASLPKLKVDPARVAVVGLSSGAYMATQTHLAWPEVFAGAALVAGGPYGCADGKLAIALSSCMRGEPAPDVAALAARVRERARTGALGPLAALAGDRVYVLHGSRDETVAASVSRDAAKLYEALRAGDAALAGLNVSYDGARGFGHNFPLREAGDDCAASTAPFLGHCGFDAAGAVFAELFGPAPRAATRAGGELRQFDQNALLGDIGDAFLADSGYLYLPAACRAGKRCGVLVAFHGCQQNAAAVGEAFVRDAGFNRWADVYNVAVLYPQTRATFAPLNPKACWDWWGYSGADYDTRGGVQQRWLMNALGALGVKRG